MGTGCKPVKVSLVSRFRGRRVKEGRMSAVQELLLAAVPEAVGGVVAAVVVGGAVWVWRRVAGKGQARE
ncbi:hypothetical protein GCM10017750_37490 [Streptomyces racemochromogenes]